MASQQKLKTTTTELLNINHPVILAGMNVAAGPKLAAAVTNAGGLGVIGGVRPTSRIPTAYGVANEKTKTGWIYSRYASGTDRRTERLSERQERPIRCRSPPTSGWR